MDVDLPQEWPFLLSTLTTSSRSNTPTPYMISAPPTPAAAGLGANDSFFAPSSGFDGIIEPIPVAKFEHEGFIYGKRSEPNQLVLELGTTAAPKTSGKYSPNSAQKKRKTRASGLLKSFPSSSSNGSDQSGVGGVTVVDDLNSIGSLNAKLLAGAGLDNEADECEDDLNDIQEESASKKQQKKKRTGKREPNLSSPFRGVSCCGKDKKWQARIRDGQKVHYLGRYNSEIEAALKYDEAARAFKPDCSLTNFTDTVATNTELREQIRKAGIEHGYLLPEYYKYLAEGVLNQIMKFSERCCNRNSTAASLATALANRDLLSTVIAASRDKTEQRETSSAFFTAAQ
jgi:hypothetical protein